MVADMADRLPTGGRLNSEVSVRFEGIGTEEESFCFSLSLSQNGQRHGEWRMDAWAISTFLAHGLASTAITAFDPRATFGDMIVRCTTVKEGTLDARGNLNHPSVGSHRGVEISPPVGEESCRDGFEGLANAPTPGM